MTQNSGFSTFSIKLGSQEQQRHEISVLLTHWKCFTNEMQSHLNMILRKAMKQGKLSKNNAYLLDEVSSSREDEDPSSDDRLRVTENILTAFRSLLKIGNLGNYLIKQLSDIKNKRQSKQAVSQQKKEKQFDPLNALHPGYRHYYLMSQCYGEIMDYQEESESSVLYRPPRLFIRGQELAQEKRQDKTEGVLLMSVEGSYVCGKRGLAVACGGSVEWWIRKGQYSGILGQSEPPTVQNGDGTQQKPVQAEDQNQIQNRKRHCQNLQLEFKFIGHNGIITAISVSYDQFYLLTAGIDNIIKLWCLRTKMLLTQYKGHSNAIWSVAFCNSGYFFLSSGGDKTIRLWRTNSPISVRILTGHHSDVYKADFMKNPDYVISCSADKTVKIWRIEQAECIRTINFEQEVINFTVSFSGRFLVTCQLGGTMTFFDILNGHEINTFNLQFLKRNRGQSDRQSSYPIHDMDFSPDEKKFACITKKEIAIYSLDTMKQKLAVNVYDVLREDIGKTKEDNQKQHYLKPKQVLDLCTQLNLIYCRYHSKNQLVVAGKR